MNEATLLIPLRFVLGTLVRRLGVCQVSGSGIGNGENEERPNCEQAAVLPEVVPLVRHKGCPRFDPGVRAGVPAPADFGWYSNLVRADHETDSERDRPSF